MKSTLVAQLVADENSVLSGRMVTLTTEADLLFVPQDKGAAYSIRLAGWDHEIGAAWEKTSKDGQVFWSVQLLDPFLPHPVSMALFHSSREANTFNLVWKSRIRAGKTEREEDEAA